MISPKFFGSNMIWWFGIVEENDDSKADDGLKLGRCRVRIMGLHSPDLQENDEDGEGIAVDQLIWAMPITPITSASMNGIGETPLGPVKGSAVFGFSFDGPASQDLYIIGTMGGRWVEKPPQNQGFRDPDGKYPKYVGEEDTNRLARNENTEETCVDVRRQSLVTADLPGGGSWTEPESSYAAVYPFNKVKETESGHVEEWDDTEGAERYHRWHRKGTYLEIDADGNEVRKITGNGFEIVLEDKNLYVKGDINITVDGDANVLVKGNALTEVHKNHTLKAKKDIHLQAENIMLDAKKKVDVNAGTDFDLTAGRANNQKSKGPVMIMGSNTKGNVASGIV